ncbi:CAP domain-containing protein [Kitasatospora sp. NPDC004669]
MVNAERAEAGCGPLRISPQLRAAAQAHSDDTGAHNHYGIARRPCA